MIYETYPKEVVLRDGTEVILRPVERADQDRLIRFYKGLPEPERWFLKEDPCREGVIAGWIENQEKGNAFCVAAVHEDQIIAHASLLWHPYGGRKHLGRLRVMVSRDFRNKRLGTWMVFDLIKKAMELGLEKMRADFVIGIEDSAIEAVRKLNFFDQGVLKNYVRDESGKYHDCMIMIKDLHKEWGDF